MFFTAVLVLCFSYILFFLGIAGMLTKTAIGISTLMFLCTLIYYIAKSKRETVRFSQWSTLEIFFFIIILIQMLVNGIGVLGPELAFDALWYHLTLPKLYILQQKITFVPGGLLYYSAMPKLGEMLYTVALSLGNEITAKGIHFIFGIATLFVLFRLAQEFVSRKVAIITVAIFYANLVVGWESITAYIDLIRTFYEVLSFFALILWIHKKQKKYFYFSALFLGAAITTKVLALGSVPIMLPLIFFSLKDKSLINKVVDLLQYMVLCLLIPLPWFLFSYWHTGNAFYPLFTSLYQVPFSFSLFNPFVFVKEVGSIFLFSSDPLSPIYLFTLPLIIYFLPHMKKSGTVYTYALLSLLVWYITPRTGGGRFLLPYLPVLSVCVGIALEHIQKQKILFRYLIVLIAIISCISIAYRGVANAKYIPFLLGRESKEVFLTRQLDFTYGDFYDIDGHFAKTITKNDVVLLRGFHNLYYVNFPFTHETWAKPGDTYNYIAVQGMLLPDTINGTWRLQYKNDITHVGLYTKK